MRLARPYGSVGVRKARGPFGFNLSLLYSLQGGAAQAPPTNPFQVECKRISKLASFKMSKPSSISQGASTATWSLTHALKMGAFLPEKRSRKNRYDVTKLKEPSGGEIGCGTVDLEAISGCCAKPPDGLSPSSQVLLP